MWRSTLPCLTTMLGPLLTQRLASTLARYLVHLIDCLSSPLIPIRCSVWVFIGDIFLSCFSYHRWRHNKYIRFGHWPNHCFPSPPFLPFYAGWEQTNVSEYLAKKAIFMGGRLDFNLKVWQNENSDGNLVSGEYRVLLPDGRTQIVR